MRQKPFEEIVQTEEELRDLLGYPSELVTRKSITHIDDHVRHFIGLSPMAFLATSDQMGYCDVSPRGDAAGFVHIIDDKHLVVPERPGNRRLDSIRNILTNPNIGIIFIIPGLEETLRVNGKACITRDEHLMEQMIAHGKRPLLGIGVEVEECYIHCAKAFKRSGLWDTNQWLESASLPKVSKILADHANMKGIGEEDVAKSLRETYEKRLY
ncbi:phosphohydrolase [Paenibacillus selenitireducens]|uniref:Phosphohydrolase n=1 Tax=Paenibacillus selenitireducens TaxID=1324314 RepID=A0A1T2X5X4_9BACL|nr:pyridoxamine 5'-phosphate oxidase family protein [Paenibacillus selenitireducens]OPA75301.1 phosphohydrolase [Paenibacillus selenitireducens]